MANRIRTDDPRGFNKGRSSKFCEGSRVRQTPEEGRKPYRPKRCGYNNEDEHNSPKNPLVGCVPIAAVAVHLNLRS